jgi:hypothetical protein
MERQAREIACWDDNIYVKILIIAQADRIGCAVLTVTHDRMAKLGLFGKDFREFSLDTARMFKRDAAAAGDTL